MPAPHPLTLCPAPRLDWSRPGAPVASDFDDIYFSTDGGLEESHAVFLDGCGLPQRWQNSQRFVIGELGFGSGLNFLATWQMWEESKPSSGHLHFVSIEKFPFDKEQLTQALSAWPQLSDKAAALLRQWPGRVKGIHRLHFGDVTLTLVHDAIDPALESLDMKADAWFLDGFSPTKNPDMWSGGVIKKLAALSSPGARLASFTVAGDVRRALTEAGFEVVRKEGFGRKRHRLEACFPGENQHVTYREASRPTIIGAGIGGLSLAQAFLRRGIKPKLIEDPDHIAASGNAAALIKPRFDLQDRPESRFFLSSYLYALQVYESVTLSQGIEHLPKNDAERDRHRKLLAQLPLPDIHMIAGTNGALVLPSALAIDPLAYKHSILEQVAYESKKLDSLPEDESPLFLAAGYGIHRLLPGGSLRFSRGQLSWANAQNKCLNPVSYGGYALSVREEILIGSTHDPVMAEDNPFALKREDDFKNFEQFEQSLGLKPVPSTTASRASVRVTTADTLPAIGKTRDNVRVLTGLGSRGFVFAPLLAEALVSEYFGDPLPLNTLVWEKFSTNRLLS